MLLDFLRRGLIRLEDYTTLVVDDCQRARAYQKACGHAEECVCPGNRLPHPFFIIMDTFYDTCNPKPRVVGLTPSPVDSWGLATADTEERLHAWKGLCTTLERTMRASLHFVADKTALGEYRPVPECDTLRYKMNTRPSSIPWLHEEDSKDVIELPDGDSDIEELTSGTLVLSDSEKQTMRTFASINQIADELGLWCTRLALWWASGGPLRDPLHVAKVQCIAAMRQQRRAIVDGQVKNKGLKLSLDRPIVLPSLPPAPSSGAAHPGLAARMTTEFKKLMTHTNVSNVDEPSAVAMYLASKSYMDLMYIHDTFNLREVSPKLVALANCVKQSRENDGSVLIWVERRLTAKVLEAFLTACARIARFFQGEVERKFLVCGRGSGECDFGTESVDCVQPPPLVVGIQPFFVLFFRVGTAQSLMGPPSPSNILGMTEEEQEHVVLGFPEQYSILVATPDSILGDTAKNRICITASTIVVFDLMEPPMTCVDRAAVPPPIYIRLLGDQDQVDDTTEPYSDEENEEKEVFPLATDEEKGMVIEIPCAGKVSLNNSVSLLDRYCSKNQQERAVFKFIDIPDEGFQCETQMRWLTDAPFVGKPCNKKRAAKAAAAFEVCKFLHERGELSELLLPPSAPRKKKPRIKKTNMGGPEDTSTSQDASVMGVPVPQDAPTHIVATKQNPKPARMPEAVFEVKIPFTLQKGWRIASADPADALNPQASANDQETAKGVTSFYAYLIHIQAHAPWRFALLNRVPLPLDELQPFAIYPEGKDPATVQFSYIGKVTMNNEQLAVAERFHMQLFAMILKLDKAEYRDRGKMYLILPIDTTNGTLTLPERPPPPETKCKSCGFVGRDPRALLLHVRRHPAALQSRAHEPIRTAGPVITSLPVDATRMGNILMQALGPPRTTPKPNTTFDFSQVDMSQYTNVNSNVKPDVLPYVRAVESAWKTTMEGTSTTGPVMDVVQFTAALGHVCTELGGPSKLDWGLDDEHVKKLFALLAAHRRKRISFHDFHTGLMWLDKPLAFQDFPSPSDKVAACYSVVYESHPRVPLLYAGPCTLSAVEKALENVEVPVGTACIVLSMNDQPFQFTLSRLENKGECCVKGLQDWVCHEGGFNVLRLFLVLVCRGGAHAFVDGGRIHSCV
jgi:hypothetical protein